MTDQLKIYCTNLNRYIDITGGETLASIAARLAPELQQDTICAHVNNRTEDLSYPVYAPKKVEFLDRSTPSGLRVYVRSLCMMLYKAITRLFPSKRLRMEHSISRGLYCRLLDTDGTPLSVTETMVSEIRDEMRKLVQEDLRMERKERLTTDVIEKFRRQNMPDKVRLLETLHELYTVYYTLDGTYDSYYGALAPSTGHLKVFDLIPYKEGMLLLSPTLTEPDVTPSPELQEKMYHAFTEYLRFNKVIKVSNVGDLNRAVQRKQTAELINVAEAMHNKRIARISDDIARRHNEGGAKVIFLAGPSSSGKTTTCKRLAVQLMTNLLTPKMISLDDYFVDRDKTPRDETGDYDYESLYALDLERLSDDLNRLMRGETINLPTYSFEYGCRIQRERPLHLAPDEILLIEGIHGLNPTLTATLPPEDIYKVYVSALTTLCIDDHNWISTTDNRLLRRIVRDYKYRHTTALETIRRWPSVRRGEEKWIFPYQENTDTTFNSSLIFELGVMSDYAIPVLREVPHDVPEYSEAYRLLRFLEYFTPIAPNQIPSTSLLREFLGGSSFHY